jgi:hypothetical protein
MPFYQVIVHGYDINIPVTSSDGADSLDSYDNLKCEDRVIGFYATRNVYASNTFAAASKAIDKIKSELKRHELGLGKNGQNMKIDIDTLFELNVLGILYIFLRPKRGFTFYSG